MGLVSFWIWLKKKGYKAVWANRLPKTGRVLVDVGSVMYTLLQHHTLWSTSDTVFKAIDKALLNMFCSRDMVELVFDGASPSEKDATTAKR